LFTALIRAIIKHGSLQIVTEIFKRQHDNWYTLALLYDRVDNNDQQQQQQQQYLIKKTFSAN